MYHLFTGHLQHSTSLFPPDLNSLNSISPFINSVFICGFPHITESCSSSLPGNPHPDNIRLLITITCVFPHSMHKLPLLVISPFHLSLLSPSSFQVGETTSHHDSLALPPRAIHRMFWPWSAWVSVCQLPSGSQQFSFHHHLFAGSLGSVVLS